LIQLKKYWAQVKKLNRNKILRLFAWMIALAALWSSLAFVNGRERAISAKELCITITGDEDDSFVTVPELHDYFSNGETRIVGRPYPAISIPAVERTLKAHPAIADAEVAGDVSGRMHITVRQRKPVVRIMSRLGESYYLDTESRLMPLNGNYTARVLVAAGEIFEPYARRCQYPVNQIAAHKVFSEVSVLDDIFAVASCIHSDTLMSALIQQIYVTDKREIELFPALGNHRILLGEATDIREKLNKLRIFYSEGLSKSDGWNKYSVINLKYKNLVVCTKK
jgi:cell division protein FtsQ